jgi:hypothetical protein
LVLMVVYLQRKIKFCSLFLLIQCFPPSSIRFLPTARLNGQADFGGQPQPSAEQGVLSCSRSFERRKTYLAVFWRFERPRQTGKRRKPKGQEKRPPRRTANNNTVEKQRAGIRGRGCRRGIPLCVHYVIAILMTFYFANVRVKPNCMNGQD